MVNGGVITFPTQIGLHRVRSKLAVTKHSLVFRVDDGQTVVKLGSRQKTLKEFELLQSFGQHPRIVKVYEAAEYDGPIYRDMSTLNGEDEYAYYSMEHLEGNTLDWLMFREDAIVFSPFPIKVVNELLQISQALLPFWQEGLFHGDLSPGNLMQLQNRTGNWKLLDFNFLAKYLIAPDRTKINLTGTYRYACLSSFSAEQLDPQKDFFAIALLMFEAITGQPFVPLKAGMKQSYDFLHDVDYARVFRHRKLSAALRSFLLRVCSSLHSNPITEPSQFVQELTALKALIA